MTDQHDKMHRLTKESSRGVSSRKPLQRLTAGKDRHVLHKRLNAELKETLKAVDALVWRLQHDL